MHTFAMANESAVRKAGAYVPDWTFADKFRKARTVADMEQREFATALNLTASTVAAYERGRAEPRFRDVAALAKAIQMLTNIDYRWFLDSGTPPEAPTTDYGSDGSATVTDLKSFRKLKTA